MSVHTLPFVKKVRTLASLSIVAPCYNEEKVLDELFRRVITLIEKIGVPTELILIDDGSRDTTWHKIAGFAAQDSRVKGIRLSRNFGHQLALTSGLEAARGQVVVAIDADLQDPPELIEEMLARWKEGYDVVYAQRLSREGESWSKRFFAFAFYRVMEKITGISIPKDTGDFRLMDAQVVHALCSLKERHRFIRGMVSWVGFPQTAVQYHRASRFAGETKYPFKKSLKLAIHAISSFSYAPLRIASYLGAALSAVAFAYIGVILILKILGINFPGYTSLMASILLLGGVQLIVLGIMGEYIGRIFEQGQGRPLYLVQEIYGEPLLLAERTQEVANN